MKYQDLSISKSIYDKAIFLTQRTVKTDMNPARIPLLMKRETFLNYH